ncbi:MAG: DUF1294 domain-containing protein [Lachnospiraceae bacterium]|nr:DUF1294 domain-containing protein [Lachnospiraceae bacterium]
MKIWVQDHILLIAAILCVTNGIAFVMMFVDKRRAQRRQWRIPERTLLLSAFLFGGIGSMLGMYLCRHKTKHLKFQILVPLAAVIQIGALLALLI